MIRRVRDVLLVLAVLMSGAQPAFASTLASVTSITGSAFVLRGNSVEQLRVGSPIEKGDRIIVKDGGSVTLSSGEVLRPGSSTITKGKSGKFDIVATTATGGSTSYGSNKSKLFSSKSGGDDAGSYGGKDRDRDDKDRRGGDDDDDRYDDDRDDDRDDDKDYDKDDRDKEDGDHEDDDDHDEDDDDKDDYGDPDDCEGVSH